MQQRHSTIAAGLPQQPLIGGRSIGCLLQKAQELLRLRITLLLRHAACYPAPYRFEVALHFLILSARDCTRGRAFYSQEGAFATMPRFFIQIGAEVGDTVFLQGEQAAHMKVLRMRPGECLVLADGLGQDYHCSLLALGDKSAQVQVESVSPSLGEARVRAAVYAALPKGERSDFIVQKSVELGAAEIVFFHSERCVAKLEEKSAGKKLERWNRIAEEAAMQSGRGKVPLVRFLPGFAAMAAETAGAEFRAFLWEEEHALSLKAALEARGKDFTTAALITGPEGGFSAAEAERAKAAGVAPVTVGRRILRCETAPLCALTALMYHTDDLN